MKTFEPNNPEHPEFLWQAVSALKVPVVAAGASGTGRQLAAALAMGARRLRNCAKHSAPSCSPEAQGVTMATRFLCTVEAPIDIKIKESERLKRNEKERKGSEL